jgi:ribosome-binding factor A
MLPADLLSSNRAATKGAQLADALRDLLSPMLQRDFPGDFLTVVSVSLSLDKRTATVWLRCYDMERLRVLLPKIRKSSSRYRHLVLQHMQRRAVPELRFSMDTNPEANDALDSLLNSER